MTAMIAAAANPQNAGIFSNFNGGIIIQRIIPSAMVPQARRLLDQARGGVPQT